MTNANRSLTRAVRDLALAEGAALVGFAPVERFNTLPRECGPRPTDVFPEARTAISIAVQMPDVCMERAAYHDYGDPEGGHVNVSVSLRLNQVACKIARLLERNQFTAFPISATIVWRYRPYKQYPTPFLGDVSHRHMAVGAGLGEIGWNGLLMTEDYGPRVRLATVITNAVLTPSPMYDKMPLCDRCMRCVRSCAKGVQGLVKEVNGKVEIEIGGKKTVYANKNLWRCAWTENFAIKYDAPKPEHINEQTMKEVFRDITRNHPDYLKTWTVEPCWGECLPAHLRVIDPDYSHVPRRKKTRTLEGLGEKALYDHISADIKALLDKRFSAYSLKVYNTNGNPELKKRLREYMPDIESIIFLNVPFDGDDVHIAKNIWQQMLSAELDVMTYVDRKGYSGLQMSYMREARYEHDLLALFKEVGYFAGGRIEAEQDRKLAEFLLSSSNFPEGADRRIGIIGTSFAFSEDIDENIARSAVSRLESSDTLTAGVKSLGRELELDFVGIAGAQRIKTVADQLRAIYQNEHRFDAWDNNRGKGPYLPTVKKIPIEVKDAYDYLPGAHSVVVVGLKLSEGIVKAKQGNPAEAIGPYAAHRTFLLDELAEKARRVVGLLRGQGFRAVPVFDLCGLGSEFPFPIRERRPDAFSSRYAAVAAGLGELGKHGMVLTPDAGVKQIFMSIVTDAPLDQDALYGGERICRECGACIAACPARAFDPEKTHRITLENRTFQWNVRRFNHCDWAKKYSLVGDEGARYSGSVVDIPPPEVINERNLADALSSSDEIQKEYFLVMEPCVVECPAGRR
ncbi:MAG: hypothetical protein PHR35_11995 [Kiritimatiellae bacterium]|nr:hypothetical protein [Kiritimatiellia bacterium]